MSPRKTPQEKLQTTLDAYNAALAQVQAAPSDRDLRVRLSSAKANVKFVAKSLGLAEPTMTTPPPIPDPKPKGGSRPGDGVGLPKVAPAPRVVQTVPVPEPSVDLVLDEFLPKAGPGPDQPPTPDELWDAMKATPAEPPTLSSEQAHRVVEEQLHQVVQAAGRPPQVMFSQEPGPTAREIARGIAREFWPLCQALDEEDDRQALRPALDAIHARLQMAYALLDEAALPAVG